MFLSHIFFYSIPFGVDDLSIMNFVPKYPPTDRNRFSESVMFDGNIRLLFHIRHMIEHLKVRNKKEPVRPTFILVCTKYPWWIENKIFNLFNTKSNCVHY